jgi:hypothetical protein
MPLITTSWRETGTLIVSGTRERSPTRLPHTPENNATSDEPSNSDLSDNPDMPDGPE